MKKILIGANRNLVCNRFRFCRTRSTIGPRSVVGRIAVGTGNVKDESVECATESSTALAKQIWSAPAVPRMRALSVWWSQMVAHELRGVSRTGDHSYIYIERASFGERSMIDWGSISLTSMRIEL